MKINSSVKVLYCMNDLANGGIEKFCINVNENIDEKFSIDYCLVIGNDEFYRTKVKELGGNIFNINNKNIFKSIIKVIKENGPYSAIHIHNCKNMSMILLAAYIYKVPVRIVHSHNAFIPKSESLLLNVKIKVVSLIRKIFINLLSTNKLGCSKAACISMYGDNCFNDDRTSIIFNGMKLDKFNKLNYNIKELNYKYGINKNKINFIHIGRYSEQKNQKFLIEIFKNLKRIRDDIHLTIIGHGELEDEIKEYISNLKLDLDITLMPHDTVIPEILSTMDYFLLPSLYEGLGIVLIEAQSMGVSCFASNYVPKESQLGLCNYIKLEDGAKKWAEYIDDYISNNIRQKLDVEKLNKYKIENVVSELQQFYECK